MPQVQLNNQIFTAAQRKAATAGYASVDDYIADVVSHDLSEENGDQTPKQKTHGTPSNVN